MRIYTSYTDLPVEAKGAAAKGAVVAIGNFDGVHPGHRAVLRRAGEVARAMGAPLAVLTFEPHPRRFFQPGIPPFRLTPPPIKRRLIEAEGATLYYELAFDATMAALTAEDFIERVLLAGLGVRHVVVGAGFAFGKGRTGTVSVLEHVAGHKGVGVTVIAPIAASDGALAASTRIRDCLKRGEPDRAAALLGRAWAIEGPVEKGDQRGRQLGFPTANLGLDDFLEPAFGVYAVRTQVQGDGAQGYLNGVANLGVRPTVGGTRAQLEAHLFDFSGDLYGRTLSVELLSFIRPERRFENLDALKAQIAQDSARARGILAGYEA